MLQEAKLTEGENDKEYFLCGFLVYGVHTSEQRPPPRDNDKKNKSSTRFYEQRGEKSGKDRKQRRDGKSGRNLKY